MKTLSCDLCDVTADGETFEEWMTALRPHYMEAHADVMNDASHSKEDMEKWMTENKAIVVPVLFQISLDALQGHYIAKIQRLQTSVV